MYEPGGVAESTEVLVGEVGVDRGATAIVDKGIDRFSRTVVSRDGRTTGTLEFFIHAAI